MGALKIFKSPRLLFPIF